MHVLDLIQASKHSKGIPYITLDVCHTRECPSWRIGKKHTPCNCGADSMLTELKAQLRSITVPEWLIKSVGGNVARKAKASGNNVDTVREVIGALRLTEAEALELIETIGEHTI